MKTTLLTLAAVALFISSACSQNEIMKDKWPIGSELITNGYKVTRVDGGNDSYTVTNLGYMNLQQIKDEIATRAENEMWQAEKKKTTLDAFDRLSSGGRLDLYIKRLTIDAANTEWFEVIIQDVANKEVYRKTLKNDVPETPSGDDLWWNYATVNIPTKLEAPFFVFVIDKISQSKYKFEVKK